MSNSQSITFKAVQAEWEALMLEHETLTAAHADDAVSVENYNRTLKIYQEKAALYDKLFEVYNSELA